MTSGNISLQSYRYLFFQINLTNYDSWSFIFNMAGPILHSGKYWIIIKWWSASYCNCGIALYWSYLYQSSLFVINTTVLISIEGRWTLPLNLNLGQKSVISTISSLYIIIIKNLESFLLCAKKSCFQYQRLITFIKLLWSFKVL